MELLQLKYFYESAKHESFAKTAEKFIVPATSVSASVKRLENELGCQLFDRTANKISLNKNGARLKSALSAAFSEIDSAIADICSCEDEREIRLLVRAVRSNVTDYIIEYNEKYPKTVFKTVFDFSDTDYEKYDIVIDSESGAYSSYDSFRLFDMKIRMKCAKKLTAYTKRLKLAELAHAPFISWGESSNMHKVLIKACAKAGFYPNIAAMSNDKECYEKLIRAGVGIGLGREDTASDSPDTVYLDVSDFDEKYSVYCYYNTDACVGSVKKFVDFLRSKAN